MKPFDPSSIAESDPSPNQAEKALGGTFNWAIILIIVLVALVLVYPKWKESRPKQQELSQPAAAPAVRLEMSVTQPAEVASQPAASPSGQNDDPWTKFKKP